ncbi:helicase-related protein, partial [Escherichia coli]|uniref:helicase-related protein n=1 Tax=Escherichia coli TaxID=562 RepID=UPI001171A7FB
ALVIEQFRGRVGPRVLCTVGVLAAGFDAPKVGAVVITRPTMSAALYEQMVGRGLRGPKNGGTSSCRVIDVQDDGL